MGLTREQLGKLNYVLADMIDPATAKEMTELFALSERDLIDFITEKYQFLEDVGRGVSDLQNQKSILDGESLALQEQIDKIEGR